MKKKKELGGPVTAVDTTYVKPIKIVKPVKLNPNLVVIPGNGKVFNTGGSSHSKSRERFREKSQGGQLIQAGLSFIPGLGQILSPIAGMIDQSMDQSKLAEQQRIVQSQPPQMVQNPFGKFADGGILNDAFEQYSAGSHASGNDLPVDKNGKPDPNGQNSVQNNENSYKVGNEQYVMSDVLTNPKTGNKFNIDAMQVNKKYPKARFLQDQRNALDLEMSLLAKGNDIQRESKLGGALAKACGGKLPYGGPTDPEPIIPPSQNIQFDANLAGLYAPEIPPLPTLQMNSVTSMKQPQGISPEVTNAKVETPDLLSAKSTDRSFGPLSPQTANALGLLSKGISLAGSISDALADPIKEQLVTPDYSKSDNYLRQANVDFSQMKQDALGISNIAGNTNRSLSSNVASFAGREQARFAQLQDAVGRMNESENSARSNLNLQKGQIENSRALDKANRVYQNQQGNMQNDAMSRYADRNLFSEISQVGTSLNNYAETQKINQNNKELNQFQVNQQLAILNSKYPNFKISQDVMELLKKGTSIDEIVKYNG